MYFEKRGKIWWYEFRHDGKRYRKSSAVSNKNDARQIAEAFRTALSKNDVGITERKRMPTFKTAMADFLAWSEQAHRAKPATHRRYRISSVALLRHFKDVPLDKITADEVERFKTVRLNQFTTVRAKEKRKTTDQKVRPATVNRELACLRAMFNHAIKADVPLQNPVSRVKALKEDNEQTRVLSYDEQRRYLAVASPMLRDVATLMLQTGMRPEEVYRIQPANVHLSEGYLFNPFGKTKAAKRRITLTAEAKSVLARRISGFDGSYLFPHASDPNQPVPKVNNAHDRPYGTVKWLPFAFTICVIHGRHGPLSPELTSSRWQRCSDTRRSTWLCVTHTRHRSIRRWRWDEWSSMSPNSRLNQSKVSKARLEWPSSEEILKEFPQISPQRFSAQSAKSRKLFVLWRRGSGSNRRIKVLQTSPLPLGYRALLTPTTRRNGRARPTGIARSPTLLCQG
jgi:integrase